jgi:cell wall-associated NlpC family hydrolase
MFGIFTRRAGFKAVRSLFAVAALGLAITAAIPGPLGGVTAAHAQSSSFRAAYSTNAAPTSRGQAIVSVAVRYVGYRYRFGGASPSGFDCSGFVYYVLNRAGVPVGRNMYAQLNSGSRVSTSKLQPGDLVFFSGTYKRGLSHAGIYIGNGKFVNAANESTGVTVSNLWSNYWASHFTAAVRVR